MLDVTTLGMPHAPSNFSISNVQSSQVFLSWRDSSQDETGFNIQWSTDNVNWATGVSVAANVVGWDVTNLTPLTHYYFRVSAVNPAGSSATMPLNATTTSVFLGLAEPWLGDLTATLNSDGSISRTDMIRILNTMATNDGGTLGAAGLGDLKTVLTDAATLNMPQYVQVLAGDVINGNVANANYQGQPLGNLAVGSTSTQFSDLVNKWFLGLDLPSITVRAHSWRFLSGLWVFTGNHVHFRSAVQ